MKIIIDGKLISFITTVIIHRRDIAGRGKILRCISSLSTTYAKKAIHFF
jgi:hypothetical protein